MNQVVNFLSNLSVTEEQGGIKRMLGVCSEFERIARVVLERAEKESHSRRKRGSSKINENDIVNLGPQQTPQQNRTVSSTPQSNNQPATPQHFFTPNFSDLNGQPFTPNLSGLSPSMHNLDIPLDFTGAEFNPSMISANGAEDFSNGDMNVGQPFGSDGLNVGSFQQPFVPQDLWQMPMTLEWDWADMGAGGGGANGFATGFESGQDPNAGVDGQGPA